ncbi:MAG: deoxyribodipyrimidine photo-lyase [Bryobacteraceae bacterium]
MSTGAPLEERVRSLNQAPVSPHGRFVLYWAQVNRRADFNQALAWAAALANELDLPLLFLESLDCEEPGANDRLFTFALEGVPETARRVRELGAAYLFWLRRHPSEPADIVERLAAQAAAVVTDDWPLDPVRRRSRELADRVQVACYAVDASCVVPARLIPERQYAAFSIRPKLQRLLARRLEAPPAIGLRRHCRVTPPPFHTEVALEGIPRLVASCHIDHGVPPSRVFRGGPAEAEKRLAAFLASKLARYSRERNDPAARATSDLSPYLHWGHISALEVALAVKEHAGRHGLLAEDFLEQLIVRRELAFNFSYTASRVDSLDELPDWAQRTLGKHARDRREFLYSFEQFLDAATHDELWNATQKELLLAGRIHGYYRMYWGKKIIECSATHEEALRTMIALHERLALDGRDPNTYTNILWCFGLHDRPFAERPVLGSVRYLSRAGMERKTGVRRYLEQVRALEVGLLEGEWAGAKAKI